MASDPIARYATLRTRLTQPVTVTDNVVEAFIAVYDHALALDMALSATLGVALNAGLWPSTPTILTLAAQCRAQHQALNAGAEPAVDDDELTIPSGEAD